MTARTAAQTESARSRRLFPESVPPAMVHEVFEVDGADDDAVLSSVPAPPDPPRSRAPRSWSKPPIPHPPHPSRPPVAPAPNADADTLELPSDELELVEPGVRATDGASLRAASVARGAWFALGGVLLLLGVAFGMRSCAASRLRMAPAEHSHAARAATELR